MSIRRRVSVVFLVVNAVTLALIAVSVGVESGRVKSRLDSDRDLIARRTADVLALNFKNAIERELQRVLETGEERAALDPIAPFDEFEMALAISDMAYWDDDPLVRKHLDRAVLVRLGRNDVNRFNPRPRFIFEDSTELGKGSLRERLEGAGGIEQLDLSTGRVLVYGMVDPTISSDWGFLFRMRLPEPFTFDPNRSVAQILWITIPGAIFLLLFFYVFFSSSVLRPLAAAERAALRISAGDYGRRLDDAARDDEIGRVAQAMNLMMAELQKFRDHMEGLVGEATDRFKKAEQHLVVAKRLAAMGQIAAGIAHEINNPLGGILNAINRLGQPDLPADRRKKYHQLAEESVRRIQAIVQRVLDTSPRGNAGVVDIRLVDVVEQAKSLLAHRTRVESIEVEVDVPAELMLIGNQNELSQVFLNLLINACDASEPGGRVQVRAARAGDEEIEIEVIDEGEGMTEEVRERIFDLFFTTKSGNKGTGLGLGIVHNIVTGHGGVIEVESAPGRGSRFVIRLPRRRGGVTEEDRS